MCPATVVAGVKAAFEKGIPFKAGVGSRWHDSLQPTRTQDTVRQQRPHNLHATPSVFGAGAQQGLLAAVSHTFTVTSTARQRAGRTHVLASCAACTH